MNDILYIYNYSFNHDLIYGILHASEAHCMASLHTNKSSWYYNKSPRKIVSGKNTFFIVDFLFNLKNVNNEAPNIKILRENFENFVNYLWLNL